METKLLPSDLLEGNCSVVGEWRHLVSDDENQDPGSPRPHSVDLGNASSGYTGRYDVCRPAATLPLSPVDLYPPDCKTPTTNNSNDQGTIHFADLQPIKAAPSIIPKG